jgi:hypothetical protein
MWFFNKKDPIDKGYLSKEKMKWVQKKYCFCDVEETNEHIFLSCPLKKLCGALFSLPTIFPRHKYQKYVWGLVECDR